MSCTAVFSMTLFYIHVCNKYSINTNTHRYVYVQSSFSIHEASHTCIPYMSCTPNVALLLQMWHWQFPTPQLMQKAIQRWVLLATTVMQEHTYINMYVCKETLFIYFTGVPVFISFIPLGGWYFRFVSFVYSCIVPRASTAQLILFNI